MRTPWQVIVDHWRDPRGLQERFSDWRMARRYLRGPGKPPTREEARRTWDLYNERTGLSEAGPPPHPAPPDTYWVWMAQVDGHYAWTLKGTGALDEETE